MQVSPGARVLCLAVTTTALLLAGCGDFPGLKGTPYVPPPPNPALPQQYTWTIDGGTGGTACAAAGAADVRILLSGAGNGEVTVPCAAPSCSQWSFAMAAELLNDQGAVITGAFVEPAATADAWVIRFVRPANPGSIHVTWTIGAGVCPGSCRMDVWVAAGTTFARATAAASAGGLDLSGLTPGPYTIGCDLFIENPPGSFSTARVSSATVNVAGAGTPASCSFP